MNTYYCIKNFISAPLLPSHFGNSRLGFAARSVPPSGLRNLKSAEMTGILPPPLRAEVRKRAQLPPTGRRDGKTTM